MRAAVLVVLALVYAPALAGGGARALRYDLRPGDHLVYRITVTREVRSPDQDLRTRLAFDAHVIVTAQRDGLLRVGFQRDRTSAEVLSYREHGRDRTAEERPRFAQRLARRPSWSAEGNAIGADGWGLLPWSAVRETGGEVVPSLRELPALPREAVEVGASRWRGDDDLGVVFRLAGIETRGSVSCARVEASDEGGGLASGEPGVSVRYWHCDPGLVTQLTAEARYLAPPEQRIHEQVEIEQLERRRSEDLRAWLRDPSVRRGALASLLASDVLPAGTSASELHALLETDDAALRRQVLAVLYRHRLSPPSPERLAELERTDDPRVRALASRLASPAAAPDARLAALARSVREAGFVADWRCGEDTGWPSRVLAAQRFLGHVPGDLRRRMTTPGFEGRRYVVHVPEEYRGDEPFPLLIALGGGPGRSTQTAQGTSEAARARGELIVYPEAHGYWWDEVPTASVHALVRELLGQFNVDPDRVWLTGSSNGGTGAFLYATLWTHRLAAVAPLMGAGTAMFEREPPAVANLGRLPMLFLHGADDRVIPARATRDTVAAIRHATRDAPVEQQILEGRGHDLFLGTDDGRTFAFVEGRRRDPFPRDVVLHTRSLDFARAHWLEVVDKDGGMAEVAGRIAGRTVVLTAKRVRRLRLLLRRELVAPGPLVVQVNGKEAWRGEVGEDCRLLQESWRESADPF
ncbi:MAG TPA: PHB depolymerase family esterase, partial [Vicinamibacteria bacterium]|nr:PHB depolymerase family esterase [Vicinamibacteria bacterium]